MTSSVVLETKKVDKGLIDKKEEKTISLYQKERNKPMPSYNHSLLQTKIAGRLDANYGNKYDILSEPSLQLVNVKESVPDIALFPKLKINWKKDIIKITQPPILAIEILSPKQNINSIIDKFSEIYFPSGVQSLWLVIPPMQFIAVYTPNMKYTAFFDGKIKDKTLKINLDLGDIFKQ